MEKNTLADENDKATQSIYFVTSFQLFVCS